MVTSLQWKQANMGYIVLNIVLLYNVFTHVFSLRGWWCTGTGCPERLWMPPLPESTQGQAIWGFEQTGIEGGVPAYSRGCWNKMTLNVPSNPNHSMILSLSPYWVPLVMYLVFLSMIHLTESQKEDSMYMMAELLLLWSVKIGFVVVSGLPTFMQLLCGLFLPFFIWVPSSQKIVCI